MDDPKLTLLLLPVLLFAVASVAHCTVPVLSVSHCCSVASVAHCTVCCCQCCSVASVAHCSRLDQFCLQHQLPLWWSLLSTGPRGINVTIVISLINKGCIRGNTLERNNTCTEGNCVFFFNCCLKQLPLLSR